jgi:hypothetical protein
MGIEEFDGPLGPNAAYRSAIARRTKCLGSRRDERAAGSKFWAASHGLALLKQPASGRHYQWPCRPNKKPRPRPGLFITTGAGNRNRTYDLRITNPTDKSREQTKRLATDRISTTRAERTGKDRRQWHTVRDLSSNCQEAVPETDQKRPERP